MPYSFRPYDPPALGSLRKRLISNQTRRAALLEKQIDLTALQLQRPGLSSYEFDNLVTQKSLLEDFASKSRNMIKHVEQQNAAATRAEADLKLRPSRLRLGEPLRRSTEERNLAILGLLQRERRQNAPLTREALARAQAVAASRKRYDPSSAAGSALRGSRGVSYAPGPGDIAGVDPCIEYRHRQSVRRSVMFAQRTAGVGYRRPHFVSGC